MKATFVTFLLTAAFVASAGCGGDGSGEGGKTFEGDGYSFTYPGNWDEGEIEGDPGAIFLTAFVLEEGSSALVFKISDAGAPVTESNIDAVQEDLAGAIQESTEGPTRLTVAGLPALRIVSYPRSGLTRRITSVFDGKTLYIFDCGFSPERAEEMKRGCDEVEESFEVE